VPPVGPATSIGGSLRPGIEGRGRISDAASPIEDVVVAGLVKPVSLRFPNTASRPTPRRTCFREGGIHQHHAGAEGCDDSACRRTAARRK
jgi:hypothetical protein